MPRYKAQDLRDLCSFCWQRPVLPGAGACEPCLSNFAVLRQQAIMDQEAAGCSDPGGTDPTWLIETQWGVDSNYGSK